MIISGNGGPESLCIGKAKPFRTSDGVAAGDAAPLPKKNEMRVERYFEALPYLTNFSEPSCTRPTPGA